MNITHKAYRHDVFFVSTGISHNLVLWDVTQPAIPSVRVAPADDTSTVTLVGVSACEKMSLRFLI